MAKVVSCRDLGAECDYVACGDTEEQVLEKLSEHGRKEHNMTELPPEIKQQAREKIHEENVVCR